MTPSPRQIDPETYNLCYHLITWLDSLLDRGLYVRDRRGKVLDTLDKIVLAVEDGRLEKLPDNFIILILSI